MHTVTENLGEIWRHYGLSMFKWSLDDDDDDDDDETQGSKPLCW